MDAGQVTGGGHHTSLTPSYDDRHIPKLGVVTLFDRRIKSITVHMGDGELPEFGVPDNPWRVALGAGTFSGKRVQAIAAKGWNGFGHKSSIAKSTGVRKMFFIRARLSEGQTIWGQATRVSRVCLPPNAEA